MQTRVLALVLAIAYAGMIPIGLKGVILVRDNPSDALSYAKNLLIYMGGCTILGSLASLTVRRGVIEIKIHYEYFWLGVGFGIYQYVSLDERVFNEENKENVSSIKLVIFQLFWIAFYFWGMTWYYTMYLQLIALPEPRKEHESTVPTYRTHKQLPLA